MSSSNRPLVFKMTEVIVKVCGVAVVGGVVVALMRKNLPEFAAATNIAFILALVAVSAGVLSFALEFIYNLAEIACVDDALILPLIKILGISLVTKIAGDVCRDGGVCAAASYIELVGGAVAVSMVAPLVSLLLSEITA